MRKLFWTVVWWSETFSPGGHDNFENLGILPKYFFGKVDYADILVYILIPKILKNYFFPNAKLCDIMQKNIDHAHIRHIYPKISIF